MKFCVKCGETIESGVFCVKHSGTVQATKIKLTVCQCKRVLRNNQWRKIDINAFLSKELGIAVHAAFPKTSKPVVTTIRNPPCTITIKKGMCPQCSTQHTDYFEGTLQVRTERQEMLDRVRADLQSYIYKHPTRRLWVTKTVPQKRGLDLYIASRRGVSELAHRLQGQFGGTLTESPKLFSLDHSTGKPIYRLTALLELPAVTVGDFVHTPHGPAKVTSLGKPLRGELVFGHKKTVLKMPIKAYKVFTTTVSTIHPLRALHPTTYQPEPLILPVEQTLKTGQEVRIILEGGLVCVSK